ncbi:serine protease [Amycolatopsis sp. H6(2020)]|nr:serine protease [Amycolatopsis sp. H6(2020)]
MRAGLSDKTDQDFLNSMVASINQYRAKHSAPPVELDQQLVDYAKSRAEHIADKEQLVHDGTQGYGENLSSASSSAPTVGPATGATDAWYGEIKDYNFDDLASNIPQKTGHFTQLVWKGSTKIGAGRVYGRSTDGEWYDTYIAVNFSPAGNVAGAFKDNVLAPKQ